MNYQDELKIWNNLYKDNKLFKKNLKNLEKTNIENTSFFNNLNVNNNAIYGKHDIGYDSINAITIKKIIDLFIQINPPIENDYFLIVSDGCSSMVSLIKKVIKMNDKKIKFITFKNYDGYDQKFVIDVIKKTKPFSSIYISRSVYDNNIYEINLFDSMGIKVKNSILEGIVKQIGKNAQGLEMSEDLQISFFNNDLLSKVFVDKISNLFPKSNVSKKIKIAISNRSNGITNILSKLIGSQDFSYAVNNQIKKKNIDVLQKKVVSQNKIKRYFFKEIRFAKKTKSNLLIVFNSEGSQMFLFFIKGKNVIYLNQNLIVLTFLHNFYNSLALDSKKISNAFIASNEKPNQNIKSLISKYKLSFKEIKNNNFYSSDYLLMFWNDWNQFVFGEKINESFSLYHLLIKLIGIIDYYVSQYGSISSLIKKLNKMYGEFENETKYTINGSYEQIKDHIKNIIKSKQIKRHVNLNVEEEIFDEKNIENLIWSFNLKNETNIVLKHNQINNKSYIELRKSKTMNWIKDNLIIFENWKFVRFIKKLKI